MLRSLQQLTSLATSGAGGPCVAAARQLWRDRVAQVAALRPTAAERGLHTPSRLLPVAAAHAARDGALAAGRGFAAPGAAPGQARGVVTVRVDNNEVDKAFRKLKRTMLSEGITRKLKSIQVYLKPSEERVRESPRGVCLRQPYGLTPLPRRPGAGREGHREAAAQAGDEAPPELDPAQERPRVLKE